MIDHTTKVQVPYEHKTTDFSPIYLALSTSTQPGKTAWTPAYRDTVDGQRVIWARFPTLGRMVSVWVRDKDGDRKVTQQTV